MRVFIQAGGQAVRWGPEGTPKWLCAPAGEPLCVRTIRQLRARGVTDIRVVGAHPALAELGVPQLPPHNVFETGINKITSGLLEWPSRGDLLVLFGDVWFSDAAMNMICEGASETQVRVFLRSGRSQHTGKGAEAFGLAVAAHHQALVIETCRQLAEAGRHTALSLLRLRLLDFQPPRSRHAARHAASPPPHPDEGSFVAVEIDDWTDDFDRPRDFEAWCRARQVASKPNAG